MTFSLIPRRSSVLPQMAASVRTLVVGLPQPWCGAVRPGVLAGCARRVPPYAGCAGRGGTTTGDLQPLIATGTPSPASHEGAARITRVGTVSFSRLAAGLRETRTSCAARPHDHACCRVSEQVCS